MNKVLVVEDEKIIRLGICTMIRRAETPVDEVLEAKDGNEALDILKNQRIDVMFTDIRMPNMDGIELANEVQKLPASHRPFIVAISGFDDFNYAVEMMRGGAQDYLLKPIDRRKVDEVLKKFNTKLALRESEASHEEERENHPVRSISDRNVELMEKAVQYISAHYKENINMAVVSNEVSLNYSQFSAAFKDYTGKNFVDYLRDLRISAAAELLKTTNLQVKEIGKMVGYENEKHFLKTFKNVKGVTPREYRYSG